MKHNLLLLFVLLSFSFYASAWDAVGHKIVADIAYQNLTKKARKQVDNLLGVRGMVYTSSWPDEIKSDTIYSYSHVWHYENLRAGLTHADIDSLYHHPKAQGMHALYALDSLSSALRENKQDTIALKFIVHIMGDMFQPMHVGHPEDKGGNKVQMKWFGKGTNLHAVWDRWLIDYTQLSYTEFVNYLQDRYGAEKKVWEQRTFLDCLYITYDRQQQVYAYQELNDTNPYHYAYRFLRDLDESLYAAGIQLAKLLNEIYK